MFPSAPAILNLLLQNISDKSPTKEPRLAHSSIAPRDTIQSQDYYANCQMLHWLLDFRLQIDGFTYLSTNMLGFPRFRFKGKVLVVSSLVRALLCHRHGELDITGVHSLVFERGASHRSVSKTRGFPTNANEYFHFTDFKVLNFIDDLV